MVRVPKKVADRLSKQVRLFQSVLRDAQNRDVNESDTVTIVTDMLADVFGFDKYNEITKEYAIRGTFCDLAIKIDGTVEYLIEVKAIGLELKEAHLRQAVNYGANHGVPWVVLTNGVQWSIYRVLFERPVSHEHICTIDMLEIDPGSSEARERLFLLCRAGLAKAAIQEFREHVQTVNRFVIAAIIQSPTILKVVRRELKRLAPEIKISLDELQALLPDVLKRDVVEGEAATEAAKRVKRAAGTRLKKRKKAAPEEAIGSVEEPSGG